MKAYKQTADIACICRAVASQELDLRCPDFHAKNLLTDKYQKALSYPLFRKMTRFAINWFADGMFNFHYLRTVAFDKEIEKCINFGCQQLVILGAGLDTRAYRLPCLSKCMVYEVDLPNNQEIKIRRLQQSGIEAVAEVQYVTCDLSEQALTPRLLAKGFSKELKTIVLCEGLCMYLPEKNVAQIVADTRSLLTDDGHFLFDYLDSEMVEKKYINAAERRHCEYVSSHQEPYQFGWSPEKLPDFLNEHGLILCSDLSGSNLQVAYCLEQFPQQLHLPRIHIAHAALNRRC